MFLKFQNHLASKLPFLENKKLFLAVSGGLDSMVLLHLFQKLSYEIAVLHCNFQLRGLESFGDQNFIQNYCDQNKISIFTTQFDTQVFSYGDHNVFKEKTLFNKSNKILTNYWDLSGFTATEEERKIIQSLEGMH